MADVLRVKTVTEIATINSVGQTVESLPVRSVDGTVQNEVGQWVDPITVEEGDDGVPVRFVTDAVTTNSIGQPVAATPVKGGGGFVRNAAALQQPEWQAILSDARSGTAITAVGLGDSTMVGYGSSGTDAQMRQNGFLPQLAAALSGKGIYAQANGWLGNGNIHSDSPLGTAQYDDRVTYDAGWDRFNVTMLGGKNFNATAAATLGFSVDNVDAFDLYAYANPGLGDYSWNVDGGSDTTVSTVADNATLLKTTISTSLGSHTANVDWQSGTIYFVGASARNTSVGGIDLLNAGIIGAVTDNFTENTSPWSPLNMLGYLAPRLTIICFGINHWNREDLKDDVSGFSAGVQALITKAQESGVVALSTPFPSNPADSASLETQLAFVTALPDLATSNDIPLFDFWAACGSSFNSALSHDSRHPNYEGYGLQASIVANALAAA